MASHSKMASWGPDLLTTWVLTPLGCVMLLYCVLGVEALIGLGTVAFPASVACLLILFLALLAGQALLPERCMRTVVKIL